MTATYNDAWRALRRIGWISKPPSRGSLDSRHIYIRPGGDLHGQEGVDYVFGGDAVVDYYNRLTTSASDLYTTGAENTDQVVASGRNEAAAQIAESERRGQLDAMRDKSGSHKVLSTTMCAVCNSECSQERGCSFCGAFLHHFCSHDVCRSLEIRGTDGRQLEDFGNCCYCSRTCYNKATGVNAVQIDIQTEHTAKNLPHDRAPTNRKRSTNADAKSAGGKQKKKRKTSAKRSTQDQNTASKGNTDQVQTAFTSKQKAARIKTVTAKAKPGPTKKKAPGKAALVKKAKTADAFKAELLRRVQASGEKLINTRVAFSASKESWMPHADYKEAGDAFLVGVITRCDVVNEKSSDKISVPSTMFEVRWTNTAFQKKAHSHHISEDTVSRGIKQFCALQKNKVDFGESWSTLCHAVPALTNLPALTDEFEELDDASYREFSARKELQISLSPAEVEAIGAMTFSPTDMLPQPPGLYTQADGSTTTKLRDTSKKCFGHSATSSFFAFLPLSFWKQVVAFTNEYAAASDEPSSEPIQLSEMMNFLGIMWYMALFKKGEMRNYWCDSGESDIFPEVRSANLGVIMSWKRFLYLRKNLAFRSAVTTEDVKRDPAARIRPLMNMLKRRCMSHVLVGRNIAVDEASIACRSQYARHIIVYNPRKPTGKYHFKLYTCCCSTTWLVLNFKLHCSSKLRDRLDGVVPTTNILRVAELTKDSTDVRSHVIEVTSVFEGTRRIVNTDNYYSSCLLLESLRSIGLYGRGTIRKGSQHFPKFTMLKAKDDPERGATRQGVCKEKGIIAASWADGFIVNIISNADASSTSTVFRRIKQKREPFQAPTCIKEYNAAMQGVDRHDQLRGRFSIADGHSFKKWHKKVAMAMIDIARCNAYICHELARGSNANDDGSDNVARCNERDKHRGFVSALVKELFDGSWAKWLATDDSLVFNDVGDAELTPEHDANAPTEALDSSFVGAIASTCVAKEAWIALKGKNRSTRECTVCKFECRDATQRTDYCETHKVSLCKRTYPADSSKSHLCQHSDWTCWKKFHEFYLPKNVYSHNGNLKRSSPVYKAQAIYLKQRQEQRKKKKKKSDGMLTDTGTTEVA